MLVVVFVANAILSVPLTEELKRGIDKHREIKWVEVARSAIEKKLVVLDKVDEILAESTPSEEDAERIGHKIKAKIRKRLK